MRRLLSICAVLVIIAGCADSTPRVDLAITGARIFDGTGAVVEDTTISIVGDRIETVGGEVRSSVQIDAEGRTVIPGLIDAHVHLIAAQPVDSEESLAEFVEGPLRENLKAFLEHGVTTIRSTGDVLEPILSIRDELSSGALVGPRLFVVGPVFTAPGGHPATTVFRGNPWQRELGAAEVATPDEAIAEVRRVAQAGVDGLKLVYQGSPDPARPYPGFGLEHVPRVNAETMHAIVAEGHRHGLRVTAHAFDAAEVGELLAAGIDGLEHPAALTRQLLEPYRERGAANVPTLHVVERFVPGGLEQAQSGVKMLYDARIPIALGTDTFGEVATGRATLREAELLVDAGIPPTDVIIGATRNGAQHIGQESDLGTIEPGKLADLVVLERDPLEDISALRDPWMVIRGGAIVVDNRNRD